MVPLIVYEVYVSQMVGSFCTVTHLFVCPVPLIESVQTFKYITDQYLESLIDKELGTFVVLSITPFYNLVGC